MISGFITVCVTAVLTGSFAWIFTIRPKVRKLKADAEGSQLTNFNTLTEIWKKLSEGQERRITMLENEVKELKLNSCTVKDCQNRKRA